MIKCKKCGSVNLAYEPVCRKCESEFNLTLAECDALVEEAHGCIRSNDYTTAVDIYRFLAALGEVRGEVALATLLEKGTLVPRDLDMATSYFYSAAKKGDAYAAYRYSRLISRLNESAGGFWIAFSALFECEDAFSDAFEYYTRLGDSESSSYYCYRLAEKGDTDAIVEMARRHLYGTGVEQNESYAKWYMQQLKFPPLYAIKLANRLYRVGTAKKPPKLEFKTRDKILRTLINEAKRYELRALVLKLSEAFSKSDAPDASVNLANLYIEGIEFKQDVEKGISLLENAMRAGSSMGAKCLGDLFAVGKHVERDLTRAIGYYRHAATLGSDGAFESIGDIFCDGVLTDPERAFALSLYDKGAAEGDENCRRKAAEIRKKRKEDYDEACALEADSPEEAFILFERSMNAGYIPTHAKIARYYENGIGTKKNRKAAFNHYKAAVESGDSRSVYDLGRCYANGIGCAFNFKLASKYLTMAKNSGNTNADRELYRIYENKKKHMTRALYSTAMRLLYNGRHAEGRELLEVCIELGVTEAIYALGCLYEFGIGMYADRRTALILYKKAFAEGYRDPGQTHKQKILKMAKRVFAET